MKEIPLSGSATLHWSGVASDGGFQECNDNWSVDEPSDIVLFGVFNGIMTAQCAMKELIAVTPKDIRLLESLVT